MPLKDPIARKFWMKAWQKQNAAAYMRTWRKKNPVAAKAIDARKRDKVRPSGLRYNQVGALRRHRVTETDYVSMISVVPGCAVCGKLPRAGRRLSVDHDHVTGRVRGLLCGNCNSGLGHFKDNPAALRAAIEYLG